MNGLTTTIKGRRYEVRAISFDGRTFFCVKDILSVCGIRYSSRWVQRAIIAHADDLQITRLTYPMTTNSGRREIAMLFVDVDGGKRIIELTNCTEDAKKWLSEDVFTYSFPASSTAPDKEVDPPYSPLKNLPDLNSRIDAILIELIELKKSVMQLNV